MYIWTYASRSISIHLSHLFHPHSYFVFDSNFTVSFLTSNNTNWINILQSRPDRDYYVNVYYDNIKEGHEDQFQKTSNYDSLGSPYDYNSLTHYGSSVSSKDGNATIGSKGNSIGQRIKMSRQDVLQVRLVYQCETGPRHFDEYKTNRCTKECKCGKNWKGCGSSNLLCKGNLQCMDNVCVPPPDSS